MNQNILPKLEAHTDSLLSLLIAAYSHYLFLRPMMFNTEVITRYNDPAKRAGFEHFRRVLYRALVLEVAKLCDDTDSRSPSIAGLRKSLLCPGVKELLENRYSRSAWPRMPGDTDESYARAQAADSTESRQRFQNTFAAFMTDSEAFLKCEEFLALQKARDSQLAHNELKFIDGKYQFAPIEDLKYGHERKALETAHRLVEQLTSLVRQTSFAWNTFYEPEAASVCAYWDIKALAEPITLKV